MALAELAARQWGVVSLAQVRALGISAGAVEHRLLTGRLHRVHRGVYAVGHAHLGPEARRLAAVLASGPGAVLSHRSAAAHWKLLPELTGPVEVTAPASRHGVAGIRLHRARSLDARDTTRHETIPITTVPRTLLDLASTADAQDLEQAIAQAQRLRRCSDRALAGAIARANGHRGTRTLRETATQGAAFTRSRFERRFLALLRRHHLPAPKVNHPLAAPDHRRLEVDFHWPAHGLVVETDGWESHGTRHAFEQDRRRDAALTAAGYRVVRFTWWTDPHEAVRRLQPLLTSGGA
jgi:very-short-patch-repair endonuclease